MFERPDTPFDLASDSVNMLPVAKSEASVLVEGSLLLKPETPDDPNSSYNQIDEENPESFIGKFNTAEIIKLSVYSCNARTRAN